MLLLTRALTANRKLDTGNPNPGNLGNDFSYLGMDFWTSVAGQRTYRSADKALLEDLNRWRNAFAHQDFTKVGGRTTVRLRDVTRWRRACDRLASSFDKAVCNMSILQSAQRRGSDVLTFEACTHESRLIRFDVVFIAPRTNGKEHASSPAQTSASPRVSRSVRDGELRH